MFSLVSTLILGQDTHESIGKSNGLFHRPQHGVSPPAPRQRLASPVGSRQAPGPRRRARTGRVAGDGQPALLGLLWDLANYDLESNMSHRFLGGWNYPHAGGTRPTPQDL
jgi:hypothetical protein